MPEHMYRPHRQLLLTHHPFLSFHTLEFIRYQCRVRIIIYLEGFAKPTHGMSVKFPVYVISSTVSCSSVPRSCSLRICHRLSEETVSCSKVTVLITIAHSTMKISECLTRKWKNVEQAYRITHRASLAIILLLLRIQWPDILLILYDKSPAI